MVNGRMMQAGKHAGGARTENPITRPTRSGISRSKLAQRQGNAFVQDQNDNPAQENRKLTPTVDGRHQRSAFTVGNRCNRERLEKQCPQAAVALQFFFVPKHGELAFLNAVVARIWARGFEFLVGDAFRVFSREGHGVWFYQWVRGRARGLSKVSFLCSSR